MHKVVCVGCLTFFSAYWYDETWMKLRVEQLECTISRCCWMGWSCYVMSLFISLSSHKLRNISLLNFNYESTIWYQCTGSSVYLPDGCHCRQPLPMLDLPKADSKRRTPAICPQPHWGQQWKICLQSVLWGVCCTVQNHSQGQEPMMAGRGSNGALQSYLSEHGTNHNLNLASGTHWDTATQSACDRSCINSKQHQSVTAQRWAGSVH